ncbi:MAG: amidohydrolase family protein [Luteitalea sp.]|nr:amidohydrolase family protein [Luteitalea sp.]
MMRVRLERYVLPLILLLAQGGLLDITRVAAAQRQAAQSDASVDILIRGGLVVDGTGRAPFTGDVAVKDGRITEVGQLDATSAETIIDAQGLVVAPGFIDVHTHADRVARTPDAENFTRMGVTTIVAGNCGSSVVDVGEALREIERTKVALNVATLVGHNTVRATVMGRARRPPTDRELERMRAMVAQAMRDGAIGLSTGLEYVPGTYAETPEIVALAEEACRSGGLYTTHMRNEGTAVERAVTEAIEVGRQASCPVQISHLKIDSPSRWGRSTQLLQAIQDAQQAGVDVRADQYAYAASSSSLSIRFPSWVLEGGAAAIEKRLADTETWQRIQKEIRATLTERGFKDFAFAIVASHEADPSVNGLSIADIAEKRHGSRSLEHQLEVARALMRAGGARMVYHVMSEEDVRRIMRDPSVAVASDASVLELGDGVPHPRGYGNTARLLAHYVRETQTLQLEEAVRKMTSLPASHFGFRDRGVIEAGARADLVLFDQKQVDAPSTFEKPHAYATGIPHVLVNGVFVIRDDKPTGARPGMVLKGGSDVGDKVTR